MSVRPIVKQQPLNNFSVSPLLVRIDLLWVLAYKKML